MSWSGAPQYWAEGEAEHHGGKDRAASLTKSGKVRSTINDILSTDHSSKGSQHHMVTKNSPGPSTVLTSQTIALPLEIFE